MKNNNYFVNKYSVYGEIPAYRDCSNCKDFLCECCNVTESLSDIIKKIERTDFRAENINSERNRILGAVGYLGY